MQLVIALQGNIRCVYSEEIDLQTLGKLAIARGSHVEPDTDGRWFADLSPVSGPVLGPFSHRTQALQAENTWLEMNWMVVGTGVSSDGVSGALSVEKAFDHPPRSPGWSA